MWTGSYCQTRMYPRNSLITILFFMLYLADRIYWPFDGSLQDLYNNFNGVGINGPTYRSPGYNGAGQCLLLTQSSSQSVSITSPFLDLTYKSFTLQAWMYADSLYNGNPYTDNAIFGQCQQTTVDRCLHIILRNQRIYLGLYGDDVQGNQVNEGETTETYFPRILFFLICLGYKYRPMV